MSSGSPLSPLPPLSARSTWVEPRVPDATEWPILRTAINRVFRPNGGDLIEDCPLLFDRANRHNLRVVVRDPLEVTGVFMGAHAAFVIRDALVGGRRLRIACVGAVFTTPGERGQGLASRVLAGALGDARRGADLILASGDRGLYRRQGLEPLPPLARFRLPASIPAVSGLDIRSASFEDLAVMAVLHDAEPVRFVRPFEDWRRLWAAQTLVDAAATFSIVRGQGQGQGRIVAYIVAQRQRRLANGSLRPRRILEIAGDRGAIVEVAPLVAEELLVPTYDFTTIGLCTRKGWIGSTKQFLITAQTLTADIPVVPWYGLNYV